jgi:hypothetical protein
MKQKQQQKQQEVPRVTNACMNNSKVSARNFVIQTLSMQTIETQVNKQSQDKCNVKSEKLS